MCLLLHVRVCSMYCVCRKVTKARYYDTVSTYNIIIYIWQRINSNCVPLYEIFLLTTLVCVQYVLCMCAVCTVHVYSMYCVCVQYVLCVCSTYCVCVQYVRCMCAVRTVHVCSMYCACVQYVLCTYTVCTVYVYSMYCVCVQYVLCMCAVRTVYVCSTHCVCVQYVLCMCAVRTVYVCSTYCVCVVYVWIFLSCLYVLSNDVMDSTLTTSSGGIDDVVFTLIETSREQEIPVVFALTRQHMGRIMKKKVPISAVGIFSYDGAEVGIFIALVHTLWVVAGVTRAIISSLPLQRYYKPLLELVEEARQKYQILLSGQQIEDTPDQSAEQQQQQQQKSRDSPQESISYQMCTDLLQSMRVHGEEEGNHDDSDEVGTPPDYEEDSPPLCDTPTDQAPNKTQSKSNFVFNVNAPIFRPNFTYSSPKN